MKGLLKHLTKCLIIGLSIATISYNVSDMIDEYKSFKDNQ